MARCHHFDKRAVAGDDVKDIARPDAASPRLKLLDILVLGLGFLLIAPPLASVVLSLPNLPALFDRDVAGALSTSLAIVFVSAAATCLMALALA